MWQEFYDSAFNQPIAGTVLTVASAIWIVQRKPSWLRAALLVFAVQLCLDNFLTGAWNPIPPKSSWNQPLAILFVILGDWRFFLLTERFGTQSPRTWRPWLLSLGFALIVPVVQGAAIAIFPQAFPLPRHTFLAYELLFLALAIAWRSFVLPARLEGASESTRKWLFELSYFEIAQYALWPLADVLILAGTDQGREAGYALRLVPNLLYYGLFLAFAAWRAPDEVWE